MQSRENVYPVYKYVKEITDADIDNLDLDDSLNDYKIGFKRCIRNLNLNDEINILNSNMPYGWFLYEKKNSINKQFLPKSFLNTNFEKVFYDTNSNVKPSSLGGKRKRKRKTTRPKSKNKRNMSKRRK